MLNRSGRCSSLFFLISKHNKVMSTVNTSTAHPRAPSKTLNIQDSSILFITLTLAALMRSQDKLKLVNYGKTFCAKFILIYVPSYLNMSFKNQLTLKQYIHIYGSECLYSFIGMFALRVGVIDSIWAVQTLDLNKSEHTELFRLSNLIFFVDTL